MIDLIEKKLEEHAKKILDKKELSMDDINFLIFLMNRLENKEAIRSSKENKEKLRLQQETNNKAWREHMYAMLENIGK